MKSIKQIQDEMNSIQVEISTGKDLSDTMINRLKKRYSFMVMCKMYLESNPTVEFLDKEKDRLSNRVNLINAGYEPNQRLIEANLRKEEQAEHNDYNKIMGLKLVKDQLQSIKFILS